MSEHAHKNTNNRGKLMCEHAHNKCTGNWKKREGKSHVPEHALKKHQVLFMSMLRHDFPSLFSVAILCF